MSATYSNLLRRTFAAVGAGLLMAASLPAASQGTVTLTGASGNSCTYTQMVVQPNGSINVTCVSTTPGVAYFTAGADRSSGAAGTVGNFSISRSGGPAGTLSVGFSVSGGGCTSATSGSAALADGASTTVGYTLAASGSCSITITAPTGHTASVPTATVTVQTSTGVPPVPTGCPAPEVGSIARQLEFGPVDQLRMKSGVIAYYPVVPNTDPQRASMEFTQGQQPNTPGNAVTEFSVSTCPGTISTAVPDCYYKSSVGQVNSNKIVIYTKTKPEWGWTNQASMSGFGCLADASLGTPYYVNVRWTYPSCVWGEGNCGFSMQWAWGAW